jgi:hypothetical protein
MRKFFWLTIIFCLLPGIACKMTEVGTPPITPNVTQPVITDTPTIEHPTKFKILTNINCISDLAVTSKFIY